MKKGMTIGFIVIVIIILLVVYFVFFSNQGSKSKENNPQVPIIDNNNQNIKNTQIILTNSLNQNITVSNIEDCYKLQDPNGGSEFIKNKCYYQIGHKNTDLTECDRVNESLSYQGECDRGVADSKNDSSICELIKNDYEKDTCYYSFAIKTLNVNFCDKINNFGWDMKSACYSWLGQQLKDINICNKILDNKEKQKCISKVQ